MPKLNTTGRYVFLVIAAIIVLHSIFSFTHEDYGKATSIGHLTGWSTSHNPPHPSQEELDAYPPPAGPTYNNTRRANATILMLARNSDLEGALRSVRELEDRFNHKFGYPWTFLNEEPFSNDFKRRVSNVVSGPVTFGQIPHEHWYQPDWVDEEKAKAGRDKMVKDNIIYGGSVSYRNMCRFNSGFFYRHPLVLKYRWYWRVEPDVHFHCDIESDPFIYMEDHNKLYGFTISLYEFAATIETLWKTVKSFTEEYPQYVSDNNAMNFVSDDGGKSYNLCHFWSNFEIADLNFWRGEAYTKFFDYLDATGGFYYERWGDAPVHSIAAALFAPKDQIHFFDNIGYQHHPFTHCPKGPGLWHEGHCSCNLDHSFDYQGYSCMKQWDRIW